MPINNSEQLKYIFRLILILDTQHEPNEEARLDKAFRRFGADEADLQLFDAYGRSFRTGYDCASCNRCKDKICSFENTRLPTARRWRNYFTRPFTA